MPTNADAETELHSNTSEPHRLRLARSRNSNIGGTIVLKRPTSGQLTTVSPKFLALQKRPASANLTRSRFTNRHKTLNVTNRVSLSDSITVY